MSKKRHNRHHNRSSLDDSPYDEPEYQPKKAQKPKYTTIDKLADMAKPAKKEVYCRWCNMPGRFGFGAHEECPDMERMSRGEPPPQSG